MRIIVIAGIVAAALTPPAVWLYYEMAEDEPALSQSSDARQMPAPSSDARPAPARPSPDAAATDEAPARTARVREPATTTRRPATPRSAPSRDDARAASGQQTAARDDKPPARATEPAAPVTDPPADPAKAPAAAATDDAPATAAAEPRTAVANLPPPSFDVVRIERDGRAVIAGRAPAQSLVLLQQDGATIAEAQADANGEWVLVLSRPLPAGPAQLELLARLPDGSELAATDALAVVVPDRATAVVAAKPPATSGDDTAGPVAGSADKPASPETALAILLPKQTRETKILQLPEPRSADAREGLNLDKVDYDEQGNVVISGTAKPGSAVRLYVDNRPVGAGQADASGAWTVRPTSPIDEGDHRLRADQVAAGGTVTARLELPFTRVSARRLLEAPTTHRVIVQPGNSLWRIARRVYGAGIQFTVIYSANEGQIRNPNLIYPGQVFDLPATE